MKINFKYITWEELHTICFELTKRVEKSKLKFDRIVCISRGGLVVARILSDYLKLPVSNFTIVSYAHIGHANTPRVVEEIGVDIKGETILLLDEIVDRGDTLECGVNYINSKNAKKIVTLAPFIKPHANPKPDYWAVRTTDWVVFPYEVRETVEEITKLFKDKGFTNDQIRNMLLSIGLPKDKIKFFLSKIAK